MASHFPTVGGSQSERSKMLLDEQRAWVHFREIACQHWFAEGSGREGVVIHGPLCIAHVIKDRADTLLGDFVTLAPDQAHLLQAID